MLDFYSATTWTYWSWLPRVFCKEEKFTFHLELVEVVGIGCWLRSWWEVHVVVGCDSLNIFDSNWISNVLPLLKIKEPCDANCVVTSLKLEIYCGQPCWTYTQGVIKDRWDYFIHFPTITSLLFIVTDDAYLKPKSEKLFTPCTACGLLLY